MNIFSIQGCCHSSVAAQGSSPKHTIYVFIIYSQKGRFGPYFRDFLQLRQTYQTRTFYFQVDRLQPKPISWQWLTLLGYVANSYETYSGMLGQCTNDLFSASSQPTMANEQSFSSRCLWVLLHLVKY